MNASIYPNNADPLTWIEARARLRVALEQYLSDRTLKSSVHPQGGHLTNWSSVSKWIRNNLDLYAGVVSITVALLSISIWSLVITKYDMNRHHWKPLAAIQVYKSQVAASTMLLSSSILSIWMAHRRRFLCINDSETSKRREIKKFLKSVAVEESYTRNCDDLARDSKNATTNMGLLSGSSQTDIYPVYRKTITSNGETIAQWSHIPSLLLVQGDYIALQIGDIIPAPCETIEQRNVSGNSIRVNGGERLSIESLANDSDKLSERLPKGRTTLPPDSESFLTLCNQMQVFRVIETPIDEFLRKPYAATKSSLISRKVNDLRTFLSLLVAPLVVLGTIALFGRPRQAYGDFTVTIPLLLLSVLGILPVIGPACIFLLETMGTARILATVHPIAGAHRSNDGAKIESNRGRGSLLLRYLLATGISRFALWDLFHFICTVFGRRHSQRHKERLLRIPPASLNVLEKLGVATALVLIDDELVCETHSIPQQLLIPSGRGLKLLDLCPTYEDDGLSDDESENPRGKSFDSDSESEDDNEQLQSSMLRGKILRPRSIRRATVNTTNQEAISQGPFEVQFEDPNWWQHLPSLKCIGLACLLTGKNVDADKKKAKKENSSIDRARSALIEHTCQHRSSNQLRSLAQCIGFSMQPNSNGEVGDISPFEEQLRIHVLSYALFRERIQLDAHEKSFRSTSTASLNPDSTSVIVRDTRTLAYQLLTIGDPDVVTNLCTEAWQGEISTILPLAASDKQKIIETSNNWKLADLDVAAFCYAPLPHNLENLLSEESRRHVYLLDNAANGHQLMKDRTVSKEWSLIRNQIFLGMLGSLVVPRREIQKLLDNLNDAGVRFVYFSPRNMRRQKELAIQLGIDVAWNCAISLRPLLDGEADPHRMVSPYGDWDKNAKLPHGIEDVRKHLKEVDNVPLLVSLFTDTTKSRTRQMVEIFQDYCDTVISIGLSHLPRNNGIFASSDIAVGIDVLTDIEDETNMASPRLQCGQALPSELEFISAVAANMCAFRFRGVSSVSNISKLIEISRVSLEAAISAAMFLVTGCLSLSLYIVFSLCMPPRMMTYCPILGATLFLQIILPVTTLALAMSDGDNNCMKRVPPKNDLNSVFGGKEGYSQYSRTLLKALLPALLPQVLHPIVYGTLMLKFEYPLVHSRCSRTSSWIDIVRCDGLNSYHGSVRYSSGCVIFVVFVLCIVVSSASYVRRFDSVWEQKPWTYNFVWVIASLANIFLTSIYVYLAARGAVSSLTWHYFLLSILFPFSCLFWVERWKVTEKKQDDRAEKLRRLQFETRLGAYSPR